MKLFCSLLLVLCSGMVGIELWRRQVRRKDILDELHSLCLHMMSCVRYERTEPELMICTFSDPDDFLIHICREHIMQGDEFAEAWAHMLTDTAASVLNTEEKKLISELGCRLGRTDAEGELARLMHISERLNILHQRQCDLCRQHGKVYITTGFLAGVLIMLFII